MKMNFVRLVALLFTISLGQAAFAMNHAVCPCQKHHHRIMQMFNALQLTPEQQEKIKPMQEAMQTEMQTTWDQMQTYRKEIMDLTFTDSMDEEKLNNVINSSNQLRTTMMKKMAMNCHQMYTLLTEEQKTKLKDLMQTMKDTKMQ